MARIKKSKAAKQFAVLGLGRFGKTLALRLSELGHEVMAVDSDEIAVNEVSNFVTQAIVADATDEVVLRSLDITSYDAVVVAIGSLEPNIMATLKLKKLGVQRIIARALHELHAEILPMIGASTVVAPERDMAIRLAHNLNASTIVDFLELSPDFSMVEVLVPRSLIGQTLQESDFRNRYGVTVVAVERNGRKIIAPPPSFMFRDSDKLFVIGNTEDLENLAALIRQLEEGEQSTI